MGTGKPDQTKHGSVGHIRQPEFATVWRGYDPNQVLQYLGGEADHIQDLESQVRRLESELREARRQDVAPASLDPYPIVSAQVTDLVRTFDQEVERLRQEARAEVDGILAAARAESERVHLDAQGKAEEMRGLAERTLSDARREAEQVVSDLTARREALLDALRDMRDRMLETVSGLEATIEGPAGDQVVIMEDAPEVELADAASPRSREVQSKTRS